MIAIALARSIDRNRVISVPNKPRLNASPRKRSLALASCQQRAGPFRPGAAAPDALPHAWLAPGEENGRFAVR